MHGYGSFAKYYDQLTQNISYGERAAYFDTIIKQNMDSASVVADLACGTGSLSFELADLGYDIVGVELSEDMLSVAMQKKMERPDLPFTNPLFICQDLCELELYSPVDAAICALDSINHITDPESVRQMFRQVGEYVRPGGLFLFDVNTNTSTSRCLAMKPLSMIRTRSIASGRIHCRKVCWWRSIWTFLSMMRKMTAITGRANPLLNGHTAMSSCRPCWRKTALIC